MALSFKVWHFEKLFSCQSDGKHFPKPRSGHRVVVYNGNLFSIGGYIPNNNNADGDHNDGGQSHNEYPLFREVWRFNFATREWSLEKMKGEMPTEVASHAAILCDHWVFVFGGTGYPFGETGSNSLHEYNLKTKQWRLVECTGCLPQKKYGHGMVIHEDSLYVVGGTTGYVYNSCVHILDLPSLIWRSPSLEVEPSGRYRHELAYDGKMIYMMGGGTALVVFGFNKIPSFSIEEEKWTKTIALPDSTFGFPSPRRCHGCVQYKNDAYILGGMADNAILGDVWKFSMTNHQWTRMRIDMPQPAYFHSVAISEEGCIYIFGGVVHIDNVRTNEVYQIWIDIPPLKEMCWQTVCKMTKQIGNLKKTDLYELGVPAVFLDRIS